MKRLEDRLVEDSLIQLVRALAAGLKGFPLGCLVRVCHQRARMSIPEASKPMPQPPGYHRIQMQPNNPYPVSVLNAMSALGALSALTALTALTALIALTRLWANGPVGGKSSSSFPVGVWIVN